MKRTLLKHPKMLMRESQFDYKNIYFVRSVRKKKKRQVRLFMK